MSMFPGRLFFSDWSSGESVHYPSVSIMDIAAPPRDFSREIARGIALLNESKPGWFYHVQVWSLDLANSCDCVLGQVYGGYDRGKERLGLDYAGAVFHGFCIVESSYHVQWMQLTMQWREAILRLQQGEQSPVVEEEEEMEIAIKHIETAICQHGRQRAEAMLSRIRGQGLATSSPYPSRPWFTELRGDRPMALTEFLEAQETQQPERIEVRELCPV